MTIKDYSQIYGKKGVGQMIQPNILPKDDPRYIKWRNSLSGRTAWNKGQTKETHQSVAKTAQTMKRRGIDNFKKWRENTKQQEGGTKYVELKENNDSAFLHGMILGDGHIQQFPRTQRLNITLGTDKPKLYKYTGDIIKKVFNKEPSVHKRKSACVDLYIYQKKISERLKIPTGSREGYICKAPEWVWQEEPYLISWLRGLYEAEGSFAIHKPTYTYKFMFSNTNQSLLDEVFSSLEKLGFHPHRSPKKIQVSRKKEVLQLNKLLKFRQYN